MFNWVINIWAGFKLAINTILNCGLSLLTPFLFYFLSGMMESNQAFKFSTIHSSCWILKLCVYKGTNFRTWCQIQHLPWTILSCPLDTEILQAISATTVSRSLIRCWKQICRYWKGMNNVSLWVWNDPSSWFWFLLYLGCVNMWMLFVWQGSSSWRK